MRSRPVFWLTLFAIMVQAVADAGSAALLPAPWPTIVTLLGVAATAVVGRLAHDRATPVAAPRDDLGRPLVPAGAGGGYGNLAEGRAMDGLDG